MSGTDRVTVSESGVQVRKSRDDEQFQHLVVEFELRSDRDEPVEVRLTDDVPESVSMEDVGFYRDHGADAWSVDEGRVVFHRRIGPGEEYTTLYGISGDYDGFGDQPLAEPELAVSGESPAGGDTRSWAVTRDRGGLPSSRFVILRVVHWVVFVIVAYLAVILVSEEPLALIPVLIGFVVAAWKGLLPFSGAFWRRLTPDFGPEARGVVRELSRKPTQERSLITGRKYEAETLQFYVEGDDETDGSEEYVFVRVKGKNVPEFLGEGHEVEISGSFQGDVLRPKRITNLTTDTTITRGQWT